MKKMIYLSSVVVLLSVVSMSWGTIQSINVNDVDSQFTTGGGNFGLGTLALSDAVDVVVEDTTGNQITYVNGSFALTTFLKMDVSAGGIASGQFSDGSLSFLDSGANPLLAGDILDLNFVEVFNNIGILAGEGQFVVTGGSLSDDFVLPLGNIVQITFQVVPATLRDYSQDFTGVSNLSMMPIPEPTTISLFTLGGLFLSRRKK
jgi:hypothetical protein